MGTPCFKGIGRIAVCIAEESLGTASVELLHRRGLLHRAVHPLCPYRRDGKHGVNNAPQDLAASTTWWSA
jgi:hypothetical protein